ncbi:class I SAM-dependent methyltransferase [Candidatus Amesbacteria bacterium]|nr:class I SAM-dependent methyltransferase [Candidatus Amesbacteria bacterium]
MYFLPNHDKRWLDSILKKIIKPKILVVGGVLYGSYLSGKGLDVTVIEKNPLAAILQLYICDLLSRSLGSKQIFKNLLTDKFLSEKGQYKTQTSCSESEYKQAINEFLNFSGQSIKNASRIFQKVFNSNLVNDHFSMIISPKGFDIESFEKQKFKLPNKIVISDISSIKNIGKFDLIITNNVVDFFDTPKDFLEIISKLVKPSSTIEVSTYSTKTGEYLSKRFDSKNQYEVGGAFIYNKVNVDSFEIARLSLILGENIFYLLGKDLLSESYVPVIPYWLDQLLKVTVPGNKYQLFKKTDQYVTCYKGTLTHN